MKKIFLFISVLASSIATNAQVEVTNGPGLDNDRDNKMNRLLNGDENSFYSYRIRSKGKGTSYFVEKYDKRSLKPEFSKEIMMEEDRFTKVEGVEYAAGNVFIFSRSYDKDANKMTLYYQSVSSTGVVADKKTELLNVETDHVEFVDFEIYPNPGKTKFLVKVFHKANKEDTYATDFILLGVSDMKKIWSKRIDDKVGSRNNTNGAGFMSFMGLPFGLGVPDVGFIGLYLDDADNIYFASSSYAASSTDKEKRYKAVVSIIGAKSDTPQNIELGFDDFLVKDVEFTTTANNELVVGGFLKDVVERKGRDLVNVGIFSFTINISTGAIATKAVKMFDDKLLNALLSNNRKSSYFKYKLDYILPIGKDIFYVGEQYREQMVTTSSSSPGGYGSSTTSTSYEYVYMDVIVAKLNSKGEFEWIQNCPLRNSKSMKYPHVFKQYIAVPTANSIYILNNENARNLKIFEKPDFEPEDMKSMDGIHGSNFVYTSVSITDGSKKHDLVFNNEDYCFAPIQETNIMFMPPSDTEIFVKGKNNDLYIYTEDRGADRFSKLTLK
jgi:hypothetical protein